MFGRLLSALSVAAVKGEFALITRRLKLRVVLTAAIVALWLLTVAFLLATLTVWLATLVGPIAACAILAAFFAVGAIAIHVALAVMKRRRGTSLTTILAEALAPLKAAVDEHEAATGEKTGAPTADPQHHTETESAGLLLMLAAIGYALGRSLTSR